MKPKGHWYAYIVLEHYYMDEIL